MKNNQPQNDKNWKILVWGMVALAGIAAVAAYIHYDRNSLVKCDAFEDPIIWTTQDTLRNVTLHYEISDAPKPSFDKEIKVFWGDGRSTKQSIGLGTNISGSVTHQYATNGDKRIDIFLSLANSKTECGIHTFVSL